MNIRHMHTMLSDIAVYLIDLEKALFLAISFHLWLEGSVWKWCRSARIIWWCCIDHLSLISLIKPYLWWIEYWNTKDENAFDQDVVHWSIGPLALKFLLPLLEEALVGFPGREGCCPAQCWGTTLHLFLLPIKMSGQADVSSDVFTGIFNSKADFREGICIQKWNLFLY